MNTTTSIEQSPRFKIGDNVASPYHGISGIVTGFRDDFMGIQTVYIQYMTHVLGTANEKREYTRSFINLGFHKMGD